MSGETEQADNFPQIMMSGTDHRLPEHMQRGIERYSNFKPIGQGGKAQLHSCFDSVLGRPVAMKSLQSELAESEYERRRFLREVRVTAQLQHPNTPPIYEVGRKDDGSLYFTMKLLAGQNLYSIVQQLERRDSEAEAYFTSQRLLEIAIQACQALAYAHTHGVVHRDIKPENIWVGRFGEVVVLDWGVAKVWGQPDEPGDRPEIPQPESESVEGPQATETTNDAEVSEEDAEDINSLKTLTRSGVRPGTPLWMSPEQILGHKYIDERTDVFSMGVVLYELLTLKLPFHGRNIRATFDLIIHQRPKRPKHAAPFRGITDKLEQLVFKALEKEPIDRFQSMTELIDALREVRFD